MDTKNKVVNKNRSKTKEKIVSQRASKTWLAMLKNVDTGKINDMNAVLK